MGLIEEVRLLVEVLTIRELNVYGEISTLVVCLIFITSSIYNVSSDIDMSALHYIFTPIIQHHLDMFRLGWAHHKLRTERSYTPMQLWIYSVRSSSEAFSTLNVSGSA